MVPATGILPLVSFVSYLADILPLIDVAKAPLYDHHHPLAEANGNVKSLFNSTGFVVKLKSFTEINFLFTQNFRKFIYIKQLPFFFNRMQLFWPILTSV